MIRINNTDKTKVEGGVCFCHGMAGNLVRIGADSQLLANDQPLEVIDYVYYDTVDKCYTYCCRFDAPQAVKGWVLCRILDIIRDNEILAQGQC